MRKIAYSIFAVMIMAAATFTASAQSEENRQVSGFDGIASSGAFEVHIKIDGTESLKIVGKAETIAKIETVVEDGKLKIRMKDHWTWHNNNDEHMGKVDIYVTAKSLSDIANAGSGNMTVEGTISGSGVNIALSGSGSITGAVKACELHSSLSGSGAIQLNGDADEAQISISGSGSFNSKQLKTGTVTINIAGSGSAHLIAEKSISGHIAGSGGIFYSGNASEDDVKTFGSGRVHHE